MWEWLECGSTTRGVEMAKLVGGVEGGWGAP